MANPLHILALENPTDRGIQWDTVYWVAEFDKTEATERGTHK